MWGIGPTTSKDRKNFGVIWIKPLHFSYLEVSYADGQD